MSPERWQQIERLFHAALAHAGEERAAFLAGACGGDEALRREVETLLAAHAEAGSFIETPAADVAADLLAAAPGKLTPGQQFDHYRIEALLGAGGMGEVYQARDATLGRQVALKLLPAQFNLDGERVRRFKREARAASALNHPNIITIHEIGQVAGTHFIITELVAGVTLRERMAGGALPVGEALEIAIQLASALAAAHAAGIVHRDIKPENVMLRPDGLVKVLDFGLAKLAPRRATAAEIEASSDSKIKTHPGLVMGTVQYMSPEQAQGQEVDARTDIWSLGCIIYEMLTGRAPFAEKTPGRSLAALLERDPPPLSEFVAAPAELARIVTKTLRKELGARYQTADELLRDLKTLKQELETQVGGATTGARRFWSHKSARWPAALVACLLLALAAALGALWQGRKARTARADAALKTVAVLPFKPLAGGSRDASLELGMADTLINKLSGVGRIVVRPLSDVRKYTALDQDPLAAGRELGVDYVLEGNLQVVGDRTRATVRLLSVGDGRAIWTDKCDQECSTVFELQDAVAARLAGTLVQQLTGGERKQLAKHYTENPEAYRLYSLGVAEPNRQKKVEYLEQALRLDPNYALAYHELFGAYFRPGTRGFHVTEEERRKSEWAAIKAAQLDDTLPQVHVSLGNIKKYHWDWAGAEAEFKRALELDPNSFAANALYAAFLADAGRAAESLPYARQSDELDPDNPEHLPRFVPYVYLHTRQYDKAIELYETTLKAHPDVTPTWSFQLAEAYVGAGRVAEAVAQMEKVVLVNKEPERWDGYPVLAYAYAAAGRRADALKILAEQERAARERPISAYNFAIIYTGLGDKDRAFEYLNKAFDEHAQPLYHFPYRPMFDGLHADPRYTELLRRMNLVQ
ncbi:MAG TPA: protein kinase [Pyrinomonadaceae bacterium]|jgi:TolB-like protein